LFVLCFRPSRPLCWTNITNCKSSMSRLCKAIDLLLEVGIRNWENARKIHRWHIHDLGLGSWGKFSSLVGAFNQSQKNNQHH
jgi:hypothetical protein